MSIFDRSCIWCGETFEIEAYGNDGEDFARDTKNHIKFSCPKRPNDEDLVKKIIKLCEGKDLDESRAIVEEVLNGKKRG